MVATVTSGFCALSPADDTIYATTYSPSIPGSITSYPKPMEMDYDMVNGSSPFTNLGTDPAVASGTNAYIH